MTSNELVAGGDTDFMAVRQLTVDGDQRAIGRASAEAAIATYGWRPEPADREKARARRLWFARHWPQHHTRMEGAAAALGLDVEADTHYLDRIGGMPDGSGCSVSFCPPGTTEEGRGLLGRNYDFFTVSKADMVALMTGQAPTGDGPVWSSRPFVLRSAPADGPATTVLTMEELDGAMEGINSHGLAVALLIADAEGAAPPGDVSPQVGLSSVQLPRFLLDTCASAAEAREALYAAKQYDSGLPLHYLVADASGDSFVWERGPGGQEHVTSSGGGALCVTNHQLHRHPDVEALPADTAATMLTFQRLRTLSAGTSGVMSGKSLRAALDDVRFDAARAEGLPVRTLWRSVFDLTARTMATEFYLGEDRYSPEIEFNLAP